jgi:predicted extracellular nuclease
VSLALVVAGLAHGTRSAQALSTGVVISQVYGGGGNSGATYTHDFIELFNRGTTAVDLSSWSLQYTSASGTGNFGSATNLITPLSGSIPPGGYLLVQEATNAAVGAPLPTPDVTDASPINMSGTGGKVALVNTITPLGCNGGSTLCSPAALATIVDLVGYDGANFFEGAPTPALSNSTAALRNANGCAETDNNLADFAVAPPAPRNSASPVNVCPVDIAPTVTSNPADGAANIPVDAVVTVTFSEPVDVTGAWFDLSCTVSGAHTAAVSGGPATFTLDPDADFTSSETCTLTVHAAQVSDQDTIDPPDTLAADYIASFTPFDVCAEPFTPIYQIQGSGANAAITGNVTTRGIVVGDFEGTASASGFYLQDATGDGDPATSDGIFVFTGNADTVNAGDEVSVTGFARERFNQTALNGSNNNSAAVPAANIVKCGTGAVAPVDVTLPFADAVFPERYEGMLVRLPQALVISEYFNYDRFGEIVLAQPLPGEARAFTPTAVEAPGAPAQARALANSLSRITLDDVQSAQNPPVLRHPNGLPFSLTNHFRGGDTVQNTVGVLGYDFNLYRILPTGPADYVAANPRPAAPDDVGGSLRVASMNTLNFFLTLDPSGGALDNKCGPLQNVECRGADDSEEFTRQRDKLIATLATLNADIIGLNELENTTGVDPLGDPTNGIVARLNAFPGAGTYAAINTGTIGTDAIKVGLIYRPSVVTPVGDFKVLTSDVDSRFIDTKSRPSLAQTFEVNATGARFTVVVNHLKSKGSDCLDLGDPDTGDGQGNCNQTRTMAAQALVDWLATDPTGSGDTDFLIIGDLNSYAMEDPVDAILKGADDTRTPGTGDDYTNLIDTYEGKYAYSYVFDGQAGYLDHALASATLRSQVTGATEFHVNADEPDVLDYDTSFKPPAQDALYEPAPYRASDHDAVVVGLNLRRLPFSAFLPPVVNLPGTTERKAGAAVPLKFNLGGDRGLDIFVAGYPQSTRVTTCGADAPIAGGTPTVSTGSGLTFSNGQYQYDWKTEKSWAGTCRQLVIVLTDGSVLRANFRFK